MQFSCTAEEPRKMGGRPRKNSAEEIILSHTGVENKFQPSYIYISLYMFIYSYISLIIIFPYISLYRSEGFPLRDMLSLGALRMGPGWAGEIRSPPPPPPSSPSAWKKLPPRIGQILVFKKFVSENLTNNKDTQTKLSASK